MSISVNLGDSLSPIASTLGRSGFETLLMQASSGMALIGCGDAASRGTEIKVLLPMTAGAPCPLLPQQRDWDILLTAETHNFPCAVAPFPGVLLQCPCIKSALRQQRASQLLVAQLEDIFSVLHRAQHELVWLG